ncbi:MAG: HD-GYP domain-containing protein [Actinomycetota bacterium]|nr:HD-GYP domain-containing protein [Actinomycetota bacterium]
MKAEEEKASEERKKRSLEYFHSKNVLEKARKVLKYFLSAKKAVAIYPPNHEMCVKAVGDFFDILNDYTQWESAFSLRIIGDELFFDKKLMARESVLYYPLIKEIKGKGVGGISVQAGLKPEEFIVFLQLLNKGREELEEKGGLKSLLPKKGVVSISLDDPGTWEEIQHEEKERTSAREEYNEAVEVIRELADQAISDRRLKISKANRVVGVMLNRVGENRAAVLGLASIKSYDEYTSFHSINVLILSLALGSMLPLDRSALMILGTGALLHDLGKVTIPQSILNKRGPLTEKEWGMMREHPVKGADILLAQPGVHPLSVAIAYEHHARYDLNGYPRIKGKERISLFSRIVEIADVYDAMTSRRPYQEARTPDQAICLLAMDRGTAFDPLLAKVFIDMMGIFPVGTLVRLATGELGLVYEQNEGDVISPKVKIIGDPDGKEVEPRIVDLISLKDKIGAAGRAVIESLNPDDVDIDILPHL